MTANYWVGGFQRYNPTPKTITNSSPCLTVGSRHSASNISLDCLLGYARSEAGNNVIVHTSKKITFFYCSRNQFSRRFYSHLNYRQLLFLKVVLIWLHSPYEIWLFEAPGKQFLLETISSRWSLYSAVISGAVLLWFFLTVHVSV